MEASYFQNPDLVGSSSSSSYEEAPKLSETEKILSSARSIFQEVRILERAPEKVLQGIFRKKTYEEASRTWKIETTRTDYAALERVYFSLEEHLEHVQTLLKNYQVRTLKDAHAVLEIESLFRSILSSQSYDQNFLTLFREAQRLFTKEGIGLLSADAANKGKSASLAFSALNQMKTEFRGLIPNRKSAQLVVVRPDLNVVFKGLTRKAKEESDLVSGLFSLMIPGGVLSSFSSTSPYCLERAEIRRAQKKYQYITSRMKKKTLSAEEKQDLESEKKMLEKSLEEVRREIGMHELLPHPHLLEQIIEKLPPTQKETMKAYVSLLVDIEDAKNSPWKLRNEKTQSVQHFSLHGLKNFVFHLKEKKSYSFKNKMSDYFPVSRFDELYQNFLLNECEIKERAQIITFTPDLSDPQEQLDYKMHEQREWKIRHSEKKSKTLSFKELQLAYLENPGILSKISFCFDHTQRILEGKWKMGKLSHLFELSVETGIAPLKHLEIKPFVPMILLKKALKIPPFIDTVSQRITLQAKHQAILTSLIQCFDLHAKNIGLMPVKNRAYKYFSDTLFNLSSSESLPFFSLAQLQKFYLAGEITETTAIEYVHKDERKRGCIQSIEHLSTALNTEWEFVFFDLDLSIGESSHLIRYTLQDGDGEKKVHMLPIRSAILSIPSIAREPLTDPITQQLLSPSWEKSVFDWISHQDAPIRKKMTFSKRQELDRFLFPFLKHFTMSQEEKRHKNRTHLSSSFVLHLTHSESALWGPGQFSSFWRFIGAALHFGPEETAELVFCSERGLKKRSRIAAQLLPRLTLLEQECLKERIQNIKNYLSDFQIVQQKEMKGKKLYKELKKSIEAPYCPLSTMEKKDFLQQMRKKRKDSVALKEIRKSLITQTTPHYLNLVKCMYPLVADILFLNEKIYEGLEEKNLVGIQKIEGLPGLIGSPDFPIEMTLENIKNRYEESHPYHQLAADIERKIATGEYSSFNSGLYFPLENQ